MAQTEREHRKKSESNPNVRERKNDRNNRARDGRWWRDDIIELYDDKCAVCGWSLKEYLRTKTGLEIHHIVAVKDGGTESFDNLIALCPNCHKTAHKLEAFNEKLKTIIRTEEDLERKRIERDDEYRVRMQNFIQSLGKTREKSC